MDSIAERVARGRDLLNLKLGPEWVQRVDLEGLDLSSRCGCVLGQLAGKPNGDKVEHYGRGLVLVGLPRNKDCPGARDLQVGYGFEGASGGRPQWADYAALTAEWRAQITAQRLLLSVDAPQVAEAVK